VAGRNAALAFALALVLTVAGEARAQETVQVHGRVQWISGTQMIMVTDDGLSLAVDLLDVDQSSYEALANGATVTVGGVVASDRSRLIARWVRPDPTTGPAGPRF
jgi:hypothetical protein